MANVKVTSPDVSGKGDAKVEKPAHGTATGKPGNRTRHGGNTPTKGDKQTSVATDKAAGPGGSQSAGTSKPVNNPTKWSPVNVTNVNLLCPQVPDLLSKKDFGKACAIDNKAGLFEGSPDIVRTAINTWLHLVRDVSPLLEATVADRIVECGFGGAIKWAKGVYTTIMEDGWASLHPASNPWVTETAKPEEQARVLCALAFPKRFTFGLADTTGTLAKINASLPGKYDYTDFRWHKLAKGYSIPHTVIWAELKEILRSFNDRFIGLNPCDVPKVFDIPDGAAHNVCNCVFCKTVAVDNIRKYGHSRPNFLPTSSQFRSYDKFTTYVPYESKLDRNNYMSTWDQFHSVYLINVPKELGVSRVIAPEDIDDYVEANSILQWIYTWLWDVCPEISFEDQSRAELNTFAGSVYGSTFTKDCSGASDRIPRSFVEYLMPDYYAFVKHTLSSHFSDGEKDERLKMFATSGHPLTYLTESLVYWSAMKWAEKTYAVWSLRPYDGNMPIIVIGDDTSGPNEYSELASVALEACFAVVNPTKSYDGDHPFRESCGYDYWKGNRVPPVHWPRKDMQEIWNLRSAAYNSYAEEFQSPLSSLLSLLNQLQEWNFSSAANYLASEMHKVGFVFAPYDADRTQAIAQWGNHSRYRLFGSLSKDGKPKDLYVAKTAARTTDCMFATAIDIVYNTRKPKRICVCKGIPAERHQAVYEEILYSQFLQNGPRYATPFDELLHVSEPNLPFNKASGQPSFKLKLVPVSRT